MTRSWLRRISPFLATLAGLAWLSSAASAVEIDNVFEFKGTVTDIGVQRGPGQVGGIEYRIDGKFVYKGDLDLTNSTVTFHNLFDEIDQPPRFGNGEMVLTTDNVDLVCPEEDDPPVSDCVALLQPLVSSSSSKRIEAKYETPARFRPQMRVQIKNTKGEYQFSVRLDRGLSPQVPPGAPRQFPLLCTPDPTGGKNKRPLTKIRNSFTIADDKENVVVIDIVKDWECDQPGRYHLRSR